MVLENRLLELFSLTKGLMVRQICLMFLRSDFSMYCVCDVSLDLDKVNRSMVCCDKFVYEMFLQATGPLRDDQGATHCMCIV